ncbi:zinc metallopeptidase [Eubacterium sp.]|uniref:zinc metallopeptidase n=2 Tax=Eubacterium sp. TaxID=142586 RepID=UPI0025BD3E43|nr:zinc metallopeptidase [Eubacterium sp.]MCI7800255.1 zinc metallopeptidase [Eubacterium sp.]
MSYLLYYYTGIIMLPVFIFALICQAKVKTNFNRYSQIMNRSGMTGADAAWRLLQLNGITDVKIKRISGTLTDYYDPNKKEICLSEDVFNSRSIAAIGVACHEAGHACQHNEGYFPLKIRSIVIPATKIGSALGVPLCLIGLFINSEPLAYAGLIMYGFVALFQLITLPVEFNASKRALQTIETNGFLTDSEYVGARKVLSAAALTYVAALASALATMLRLLIIVAGGRRR